MASLRRLITTLSALMIYAMVAAAVIHAADQPLDYWNTMLLNTPMPAAIQRLLPFADSKEATAVNSTIPPAKVNSAGVNTNISLAKVYGKYVGVDLNISLAKVKYDRGFSEGVDLNISLAKVKYDRGFQKGVDLNISLAKVKYDRGFRKGVDLNISLAKVKYDRVLRKGGIADAVFFTYTDMHVGKKMSLHFLRTATKAKFLRREVAEAISFSSRALPVILNHYSIKPQSNEAEAMRQALGLCEDPAQPNEEKLCATSLESMISFVTSKLGNHVLGMSTKLEDTKEQNYTIAAGLKEISTSTVACHILPYVYPVFYCHRIFATKAFKVALVAQDGTEGSAIAVCHMDTSKWSPDHLAFHQLKVKPGTVPVCHFLTASDVAWISA